VRHTFYTPRQILDLCDSILAAADPPPDPEKTGTVAVANEWSAIIQTAVEQFTCRAEKDIRDMFGMIYAGIDEVFKAFEGRPNLWHRTQLQQFVQDRKLLVTRKHDSKQYAEEELIAKLQHLGFVGLGSRTLDAPTGTESYQMRFAFLEEYPSRKSWELAAISPMFYDAYDIKPVEKAIVKPHDRLTLSNAVVHKLTSYDVQLNCFRE
jgi:phosphoenolpyruvate synthase/pyruvate phosphate dikinase